jgi:hypothetical protein
LQRRPPLSASGPAAQPAHAFRNAASL